MSGFVLGIDTSNYTTSAAVVSSDGRVVSDVRMLLDVKKGERGLRQQQALFLHVNRLPGIIENALTALDREGASRSEIKAVAVSERPRPVEGSYMPCFLAGVSVASAAASALGVPLLRFSHQEGHIAAVDPVTDDRFLCYHLSGGTCELLDTKRTKEGYDIRIIGATRDISFGQLLDRTGVAMGYDFPAGGALDRLALKGKSQGLMKPLKINGLDFNVSGLETQALRSLGSIPEEDIAAELMEKIADLLIRLTKKALKETGAKSVVFCGGVSQSEYIRNRLSDDLDCISFGEPSSDNAVGIAKLGAKNIWQEIL